ncbi:MAG: TRAP transporter large permease subunit [Gammaproteobacteria bacterium]|nr:TRAP transporter large permease subunit [Gammaproteobacteria bacterium]NIR84410.1 TRAP transporter large permease subunit [Gammaproteobacteria bacterium]NIR90891.1 TRAP transporter large permease subunit [Gammaproteobacteria bacterium]NIU07077.1 TRAP transporter large permease subunit [Gammaproteobacteria bacterium]NIV76206.1 TRAP transporter large permease subunit [Gammaproteobacteria bacterium]
MEWWVYMLFFFGGLGALLLLGLPVAFAFLLVNLVGAYAIWGGDIGLAQLVLSIDSSVSTFVLVPVPMFILMGTVMFHSGIAFKMIDVLDEWLGRIAGRLSILAVGAGALFATLTGVAMGSVAMLGSTLAPDMERRGYARSMSLGPILASGSLAIMIPPSALAVILASLGKFSIGKLLVGILLPGFLLAVVYVAYIVVRCTLQPSLAPPYDVAPAPLGRRLVNTLRYVVPPLSVIVVVIGTIFLGVATPTEAAAVGALLCFVLATAYRRLTWAVVKKAVGSATSLSVMVLIILTGSAAFGQLLSFSGVTPAITRLVTELAVEPLVILILMQVIVVFLGMFIEQTSIVMVTIPIFMPIVQALGWDPIWFGAILMLNLEMATISPPFGLSLFVMKGIAAPDTRMSDIYRAALPFVGLNIVVMAIMIVFPAIVLWLPGLMS